jgi:hypothetical protein
MPIRGARLHAARRNPTSAANRQATGSKASNAQTFGIALFALLAACYAMAFFSCGLTSIGIDRETGLPLGRTVFWFQALLPDKIVSGWFGDGAPAGLFDRLPIAAAALLLWVLAWGLGRLTLAGLGIDRRLTRLERVVMAAAVGANLLSLYVLALGLAGQLARGWLIGPPALATVLALVWELRSRRQPASGRHAAEVPSGVPRTGAGKTWYLLAPCAVFAGVILAAAFLPPLDFDVLEYHLQAAKEFYQNGRISFLEHNVYANMPLGAEMFNLAGMVTLGDWWTGGLAGKVAIAGFAPLTAFALLAFAARYVSIFAGAIAALVYLSTPWIALVSANGLVDGAAAFFLLASLYALAIWRDQLLTGGHARGELIMLGLLAGGAVSVKYPAVVFVVLPLGVAVWIIAGRRPQRETTGSDAGALRARTDRRAAAISFGVFALAVAFACGPWFAKNLAASGNPTYPLLYRVFDGRTRTVEKDAQWRHAHDPPNYSPLDLFQRATGFVLTSDWLNPLTVPLVALALLCRQRRWFVRWLAAYVLFVLGVWWLCTHRIDRFWVPVLPVTALLAGIGATWSARPAWRWTLAAWLAVGLTYDFVVMTSGIIADCRFLVSLDVLRAEARKLRPAHEYLADHVAAGQRALLVGDATPYDLDVPALYNTVFDSSIFEQLASDRTASEVAEALAGLRVSHIYVDWAEIARYRSPGNYGFTPYVRPEVFARLVAAGILEKVFDDERGEVFRVSEVRPARADE